MTTRTEQSKHGYRNTFEWRKPKVLIYRTAERRAFAVKLNRYPGVVIGVLFQVGRTALSLLWGRPGPLAAGSCRDCALGRDHEELRT